MALEVIPRHCTIFVCDIEDYSSRSHPEMVHVRRAMYQVLEAAFKDAGIGPGSSRFHDRGDGALVLVSADVPKNRVLAGFLPSLAARLHEANVGWDARLRLRIAVHAGEVIQDQYGVTGDAVLTTMRLLDSAELRAALQLAEADLAVAVSEQIHEEVVAPGLAGIDPSGYRHVIVEFKGERVPAWIYLPGLTGPPWADHQTCPAGPGDLLHRSIWLVDIEDSDSRPNDIKWLHRTQLRDMVLGAIADIGIAPCQYDAKDTGDGWRVLFTPDVAKNRLAGPLISALTQRLGRYNATAASGAHMRLRMVLHAGEVLRDNSDFFGSALNDAYWMADSNELRDCLRNTTGPTVFMVSNVIYDGVVRHGYGDINPADYEPRTVHGKHHDLRTWVRWPDPFC